jgi:hypothetical protein
MLEADLMANRMIQLWVGQRLSWKFDELKELNKDLRDPSNIQFVDAIRKSIAIKEAQITELNEVQDLMRQRGAFNVIVEFMGRFR